MSALILASIWLVAGYGVQRLADNVGARDITWKRRAIEVLGWPVTLYDMMTGRG